MLNQFKKMFMRLLRKNWKWNKGTKVSFFVYNFCLISYNMYLTGWLYEEINLT